MNNARPDQAETSIHDELLTIDEAAKYLGLSRWVVRDWIRYGRLAAVKLGAAHNAPVRIQRSAIAELLRPIVPKPIRPRFRGTHDDQAGPENSGGPAPEDTGTGPTTTSAPPDDPSVPAGGDTEP